MDNVRRTGFSTPKSGLIEYLREKRDRLVRDRCEAAQPLFYGQALSGVKPTIHEGELAARRLKFTLEMDMMGNGFVGMRCPLPRLGETL